jgi:hypothetical protein
VPAAKVLVLSCIDPRFLGPLEIFLSTYGEIRGQYDHFILAGSSLTLTLPPDPPDPVSILEWRNTFTEHVTVAFGLHDFTEIWAFEHLDCGAYGALSEADTEANHINFLTRMKDIYMPTLTVTPTLKFKGFLMKLDGSIYKVVDSGGGIRLSEPGSNALLISILVGLLVLAIVLIKYRRKA